MASSANRVSKVCVRFVRNYSSDVVKHYKVVIAGGGTGGISIGARACRKFGAGNVAIIEPAKVSESDSMLYGVRVFTKLTKTYTID